MEIVFTYVPKSLHSCEGKCYVCGGAFDYGPAILTVADNGERFGTLCVECLAAGMDGLRARTPTPIIVQLIETLARMPTVDEFNQFRRDAIRAARIDVKYQRLARKVVAGHRLTPAENRWRIEQDGPAGDANRFQTAVDYYRQRARAAIREEHSLAMDVPGDEEIPF